MENLPQFRTNLLTGLLTWLSIGELRRVGVILLGFLTVAAGAQSSGLQVVSGVRRGPTPYDRFMHPVTAVFENLRGSSPSFLRVEALTAHAFAFRFYSSSPFQPLPPDETEARWAGDCKDKALWLASKMKDPSVRFVIGKAHPGSAKNHVWLEWCKNGRNWILDPGQTAFPVDTRTVFPGDYASWYSYDRNGSYCHVPSTSQSRTGRCNSLSVIPFLPDFV